MNLIRKHLKSKKGFTLIELLIVVLIIGVLAAIAVPKFANSSNAAKIAKIQADLRTLDSASMLYQVSNGTVPTILLAEGNLASTVTPPTSVTFNAAATGCANAATYSIDATSGRAYLTANTCTSDVVR